MKTKLKGWAAGVAICAAALSLLGVLAVLLSGVAGSDRFLTVLLVTNVLLMPTGIAAGYLAARIGGGGTWLGVAVAVGVAAFWFAGLWALLLWLDTSGLLGGWFEGCGHGTVLISAYVFAIYIIAMPPIGGWLQQRDRLDMRTAG